MTLSSTVPTSGVMTLAQFAALPAFLHGRRA